MKKLNSSFFLSAILLMIFIGCVSIKPPTNRRKAERKLERHVQGIKLITTIHPSLEKQFQIVLRDTVIIPDRRKEIIISLIKDTLLIDSILIEYKDLVIELDDLERLLKEDKLDEESKKKVTKDRIENLQSIILKLKQKVLIIKDTTFVYVDSIFMRYDKRENLILDSLYVSIKNGNIIIKKVREKNQLIIENIVITKKFEVTVQKPFFKKWWLIIGGIILVIGVVIFILKRVFEFFYKN